MECFGSQTICFGGGSTLGNEKPEMEVKSSPKPFYAGIAQVVEHMTFNHGVEGSNPSTRTTLNS